MHERLIVDKQNEFLIQKKKIPGSYSYKLLQFWVKKNIDFIDTPYNNSSETWIYHFVIVLLYKAMARTMNTWRLKKLNSIDFIKT